MKVNIIANIPTISPIIRPTLLIGELIEVVVVLLLKLEVRVLELVVVDKVFGDVVVLIKDVEVEIPMGVEQLEHVYPEQELRHSQV